MKSLLSLALVWLVGCASNPLMTGKPQDWKGRQASELAAAWGQPTRVLPQTDGSEVWEYSKSGEFVSPEQENTSFRMGGGGGPNVFGASGGITTTKQDRRLSTYENLYRFQVKNGKIRKWYAARLQDGVVVWQDH